MAEEGLWSSLVWPCSTWHKQKRPVSFVHQAIYAGFFSSAEHNFEHQSGVTKSSQNYSWLRF